MIIDFGINWENFYTDNIVGYIKSLQENPFELITLIIDLAIVIFLIYSFLKIVKGSRAWQLIKGIALLFNRYHEFRSDCHYCYIPTRVKKRT